ncbi:MAG: class II aldolase/adducin family protein, partial [Synergistaceae bacterium]|nr:class II aldolase/adducin family protein [Synergistaceae bacterium]
HGLLAAGNNIIEAFNIAEELEFCCEIYFRAKIYGTPKLLSQEDMNFALKKFKSYGQP